MWSVNGKAQFCQIMRMLHFSTVTEAVLLASPYEKDQ